MINDGDYVNNIDFSKSDYNNNIIECFNYSKPVSLHSADYMKNGKRLQIREDCYWGDENRKYYQAISDARNNADKEIYENQNCGTGSQFASDYGVRDCRKPSANDDVPATASGRVSGKEEEYWTTRKIGGLEVLYQKLP